eukprot:3074066-Lingulodinium_polyedra.AAC.1
MPEAWAGPGGGATAATTLVGAMSVSVRPAAVAPTPVGAPATTTPVGVVSVSVSVGPAAVLA